MSSNKFAKDHICDLVLTGRSLSCRVSCLIKALLAKSKVIEINTCFISLSLIIEPRDWKTCKREADHPVVLFFAAYLCTLPLCN